MIERINLLPFELRESKKGFFKKYSIIIIVVLFVLSAGAIYKVQMVEIQKIEKTMELLKNKKSELIKRQQELLQTIQQINKIENDQTNLKKRIAIIDELINSNILWSDVLREISVLMPDNVLLNDLSSTDKNDKNKETITLKFRGEASNNISVANFIFAIEQSALFENAELGYTQKSYSNDTEIVKFEILCEFSP